MPIEIRCNWWSVINALANDFSHKDRVCRRRAENKKKKNHQPDNKTKLYLDVSQNMINDLLKPLESNQDTEQGGEGCCEGNMID